MKALLVNKAMPKKQAWVDFPMAAPHIESDGLDRLRELAGVPGTDTLSPLLVAEVNSHIRNLVHYVPEDATPEQLNTLAIKIGYMQPEEQVCFEGALDINAVDSMEDILRLADELDQYEMFLDVSSVGELGRYIVNFGIMEFPEDALPYLDYERIGTEYDANHGGVFRGTSYITKMADAPAQDLDDGRTQQITLHLYTSKVGDTMPGPYRLTLPACEARLEQVKKSIGVDDFTEARIENVELSPDALRDLIPSDCASVETYNALAVELETLSQTEGQLTKLCAVLEVMRPETLGSALKVARSLDAYELVDGNQSAWTYGLHAMRSIPGLESNDVRDLMNFLDLEAYGKHRMKEDRAVETAYGLLRRARGPMEQKKGAPTPMSEKDVPTGTGKQTHLATAAPGKSHLYRWFVVENYGQEDERQYEHSALTGAIDRFNGLACGSKRLRVSKDDAFTADLVVTKDGETHIDEMCLKDPHFSQSSRMAEAVARLKLSIAGLETPQQNMTLGGM